MKRSIATLAIMAILTGITSCGAPDGPTQSAGRPTEGWVMPPQIESARRDGDVLVLVGRADPGGRVVLRAAGGVAYAVGADATGQFQVQISKPSIDTVFDIESQQGQEAAPAPTRLLVAADPSGPIALIASGSPTGRLDPAGALDVMDADGQARLASGRARPSETVKLGVNGNEITTTADPQGRWTVALPAGSSSVMLAGRTYAAPAVQDSATGLERLAGGWRFNWRASDGALQTSWFPDA